MDIWGTRVTKQEYDLHHKLPSHPEGPKKAEFLKKLDTEHMHTPCFCGFVPSILLVMKGYTNSWEDNFFFIGFLMCSSDQNHTFHIG